MKHISVISRAAMPATGTTTLLESAILLVLSVYFRTWDNFTTVVQNLSKFYQKT